MKCHHFLKKHCVSCDLLALNYAASISVKEQKLKSLFPDAVDKIKPTVMAQAGAEGTRNKAKLAAALIAGEIEFGFYEANLQFKKLEDCPLHAEAINVLLQPLKEYLNHFKIPPYDLATKKGELKYVLITYSESTLEILIRFVLRSKESLDRLKKLTAVIVSDHPTIKVVTANIQPVHQAILEGEEEIVLTNQDCIAHVFDEYHLYQGPRSFFQTHTAMALQLYRQLQIEISQLSIYSFLDLYCGVGAFSFFAAKHCVKAVGVEISDTAIFYANKAKEINKTNNIDFVAMDVDIFLKKLHLERFDAILVNPPRRGLNASIIAQLIQLAPQYLFYSSCNADSLKRDILQLEETYQIQSLQIFDMFPFTNHFETLVVMTRK